MDHALGKPSWVQDTYAVSSFEMMEYPPLGLRSVITNPPSCGIKRHCKVTSDIHSVVKSMMLPCPKPIHQGHELIKGPARCISKLLSEIEQDLDTLDRWWRIDEGNWSNSNTSLSVSKLDNVNAWPDGHSKYGCRRWMDGWVRSSA